MCLHLRFTGKARKKKKIRASRLVPSRKVRKKSMDKNCFALRALCPLLRFTGKGRRKNLHASRLVLAPKVHRKNSEIFFSRFAPRDGFCFFRCARRAGKFFLLCAALCSRSPRQILTSNWNGEQFFFLSASRVMRLLSANSLLLKAGSTTKSQVKTLSNQAFCEIRAEKQ